MASTFFPERMDYIELMCPLDTIYHCIKNIAEFGKVQLIDCNKGTKSINKRYTETYLRCEEAERSLNFIETQLQEVEMLPPQISLAQALAYQSEIPLNDILEQIHTVDLQLREKIHLFEQLIQQNKKRHYKLEALRFFRSAIEQESNTPSYDDMDSSSILELNMLSEINVVYTVTTLVPTEKLHKLLTIIFRISRRNVVFNTGDPCEEYTPVAIFASSEVLLDKVTKICESYSPYVYQFSSDREELEAITNELKKDTEQMEGLNDASLNLNISFLEEISHQFWNWKAIILKEKQIWSYVDYADFDQSENAAVFKGWVPRRYSQRLEPVLRNASDSSGSAIPIQIRCVPAESLPKTDDPDKTPPSWIETNNFNYPFQLLNDSYGVPNYDELNGGAFYSMYPILFGIMFGDVGHAGIYLLISAVAFLLPKLIKQKNEMLEMVDQLKYLLLFLSLSAFYCGWLYNECFGLTMNVFGTCWEENNTTGTMRTWDLKDNGTCVYPFGIDPNWYFKGNELIFLNSYKMKLSVVMGMLQMFFGLILNFINYCNKHDWSGLIFRFIPEILYMIPYFGYLVVVIIYKWTHQGKNIDLIQLMINIVLSFGSDPDELLYEGQGQIQRVILYIFIASIPLFLFAKPCYDFFKHHKDQDFSIMEIFVMNLIHVIEFCLSALSHTASYLRLWALSLAHSQLSNVLYEQLLVNGLSGGAVILFPAFALYALLTVAILLFMEAFSALLHAIRLMWVEFSSKFYDGMGYPFLPLSTTDYLKETGLL